MSNLTSWTSSLEGLQVMDGGKRIRILPGGNTYLIHQIFDRSFPEWSQQGVVLKAGTEWNGTNWGTRQVEKSFDMDFALFPTATQ